MTSAPGTKIVDDVPASPFGTSLERVVASSTMVGAAPEPLVAAAAPDTARAVTGALAAFIINATRTGTTLARGGRMKKARIGGR